MQKLCIPSTSLSPEIYLSPSEKKFAITGNSAPEDVRSLYYPVIEWIKIFIDDILEGEYPQFSESSPVRFEVNLDYFNSSSAKFLYDIFNELKRLRTGGKFVEVDWYFDPEDSDQKEAGMDIAFLADMEFNYLPKPVNQ